MNKRILLMISVFSLLFIGLVSAWPLPIHYYEFEGDITDTGYYSPDNLTGSLQGFVAGKIGQAVDLEQSSSHAIYNKSFRNASNASTISCWIKPESTPNYATVLYLYDGSQRFVWWIDNSNKLQWRFNAGSGERTITSSSSIPDNSWTMITSTIGPTYGMKLWINDTSEANNSDTGIMTSAFTDFYLGDDNGGNDHHDGLIDNCVIFNFEWSPENVSKAWNGGAGFNYSAFDGSPPIDTLNISTASQPLNNTQFAKTSLNFNISIDSASAFNCTLYINGSYNNSKSYSAGSGVFVNFTLPFGSSEENKYEYFFNCSNGGYYEQTNDTLFYIDNVNPTITYVFDNASIFFQNNLTGIFNFTDTYLYTVNISIDNTLIFNDTDIQGTNLTYNLNQDPTGAIGERKIRLYVADGHTAIALLEPGAYNPSNGLFNDYMQYKFEEPYKENTIRIKGLPGSLFDTFTTEQKKDRYTIKYEPQTIDSSYVFEVESDNDKIIIWNAKNDEFGGDWLVIGEHWLDFYIPTEPDMNIEINRVNDYKVEVTISNITGETLEFNSIGDLNIIEENLTFYYTNMSMMYLSSVIETESQTSTLNITKISGLITNATFYYDGTEYTVTKTSGGSSDLYSVTFTTPAVGALSESKNLRWEYLLNYSGSSETGNVTGSQTVYQINIDNCSNTSWIKALTFYSIDEVSGEVLDNMTLNIDLDIWFSSESSYRNFSFGFYGHNNYSLCIYPNESSYLVNAVMEYEEDYNGTDYEDRKYYLDNYSLDNTTDTIYLYNILASDASEITIKVYDKTTGNIVDDAFVKILRYYPEEGLYKSVEIEKTDVTGQTLAKLKLYDVFYKFIVEKDREVVLNSGVEKILSTIKLLPVIISNDVLASFISIDNVAQSVTCTNSTQTCRFTWSDSGNLVRKAHFKVYRTNAYGKTLLYQQTTEAVAGTMTYVVIEDMTGNTYLATGEIETNTAYSDYMTPYAVMGVPANFNNWGGISLLFPLMLLVIVLSFALSGVGAVGMIIGSMISLIAMVALSVIPLTIWSVISFLILGGILIAKIRQ